MVSEVVAESRGRRWVHHRVLFIGLWLTLMLLAIKVWVGWGTRSLSLAADALHTLVTCFSLLLSLLAVSAPYSVKRQAGGHTRLESGLTLALVGFLGASYCFLVGVAVEQIGFLGSADSVSTHIDHSILLLLGGMVVVSLGLSLFGRHQALTLENAMLRFSFSQSLQDTGLLALVFAGLVGVQAGFTWLDPVLTGVIMLVLLLNTWRIVNWQLPSMMQQTAIAPEAIAKTARRVEGILHCYNIHSRGLVGRMIYVELRLILHPECVPVAAAIMQRVERLIAQQYGPAKVVVHVDAPSPRSTDHRKG